jgi:hypothetical protein
LGDSNKISYRQRATIGHAIPPLPKSSHKYTLLPSLDDTDRGPVETLVGRDVLPRAGLKVTLSRRQMKHWGIKEPGAGTIFEVDDTGAFCMVQWDPPYPADEDEYTICHTGQDEEYWLATWRDPPPTPPAKKWMLDALVSPRYAYNKELGTYGIQHKTTQREVRSNLPPHPFLRKNNQAAVPRNLGNSCMIVTIFISALPDLRPTICS